MEAKKEVIEIDATKEDFLVSPSLSRECRYYIDSYLASEEIETFERVRFKTRLFTKEYDEKKFLELLVEQADNNYLTLKPLTEFKSFKKQDGQVVVRTNKGFFKGKILIKASGGDLTKNRKFRNKKITYYTTCARIYQDCTPILPLNKVVVLDRAYANSKAGQWSNPISETEYLLGEINFTTSGDITKLKPEADLAQLQERLNKYTWETQKIVKVPKKAKYKEYYGIVPVLRGHNLVENNLIHIGDAGLQTRPFYGICINQIFNQLPSLTKTIITALKKRTIPKKSCLNSIPNKIHSQNLTTEFGLILWKLIETAPHEFLNRVASIVGKLDNRLKYNFLTGYLTRSQLGDILVAILKEFHIKELMKYVPVEDYSFLLEEASRITEELIESELGA